MKELERLVEVVARLRDKKHGCPWDSVQTNMSIRRYLVEEAGEYLDALEAGDDYAVRDELGDLLLQVVLNAQIAKDEGRFDLEDVAKSEADKMVRRHPHVFAGVKYASDAERNAAWAAVKAAEKEGRDWEEAYLEPAMNEAAALIDRAKARKGFV